MTDDVILVRDRYYILATSGLADDRTFVLKDNALFAVFDRYGDIQPLGTRPMGLFLGDTRFLSRLQLRLNAQRPLLLSSSTAGDNSQLTVDLTNPDLPGKEGEGDLARDSVHVFRSSFLWQQTCHVQLRLRSFAERRLRLSLSLRFEADFTDIFEVRGTKRAARGKAMTPVIGADSLTLGYQGLDGKERLTRLKLTPAPLVLSETEALWELSLEPGEEARVYLSAQCEREGRTLARASFDAAREARVAADEAVRVRWCALQSTNGAFSAWVGRSAADLRMMLADTGRGPYPYAGVPWFSTPFGRDGIITALQTLWVNPEIAAGVLRFLASLQATIVDGVRDSEPGKILHELRDGEVSALGEVPFARYYGTVDATPLFVMLAGAYWRHTGDRRLISELWPSVERALEWIIRYGDRDGDGLVEYARRDPRGLANQGWKDSHDSVMHSDGRLAEGAIALCEVQAYAHAAFCAGAELANALELASKASELSSQAEAMRRKLEQAFWSEELGTYVLALDGEKRRCAVRSSNAGHLLFTGSVLPARAESVARTLLGEDSFSGWGVRTLSSREVRYNPMSYHNGSVWPHDNALIASGLARYGLKAETEQIFTGIFEASKHVDQHRLPELFCGFHRRAAEGPTRYPVACAPQAWASGSVFMMLQAMLGLSIDGANRRLTLHRPLLPRWLRHLRLNGLRVGDATIDLDLKRHGADVGVGVRRRDLSVETIVVK